EGVADRIGTRLMAVVAEGQNGRMYLPPTPEQEMIPGGAVPQWRPEQDMPKNPRWFSPPIYGMAKFGDIFTSRQLVALTTFSDLIQEVHQLVLTDATVEGWSDDRPLHAGGHGALAYADAIAIYLAMAIDKGANLWSSICSWMSDRGAMRET